MAPVNKLTPTSTIRWLVAAGVLLLGILLPFRIPYTIKTIGKIQPRREWLVIRGDDGQISTQLWNHGTGLAERMTVTQMLRGDAADFSLLPSVLNSQKVMAGDTIAVLRSADLAQSLASKEGQLAAAQASLQVLRTGEKRPLVEEAQHQLEQAVLQAGEQKRIVARLAALRSKQLVSDQEYEQAFAAQQTREAEIAIARSRLSSLQTGAKAEEIGLMQAQIRSLELEIAALRQKSANYFLCAPFSGQRLHHIASDTLLAVAETDSIILTMPVRARELAMLKGGEVVEVGNGDREVRGRGHLIFINPVLELLNGEQVFWAVARIDESEGLVPGMFLKSEIRGTPLSKYRFLQRFLE